MYHKIAPCRMIKVFLTKLNVSVQGIVEHMINVHYYYYYMKQTTLIMKRPLTLSAMISLLKSFLILSVELNLNLVRRKRNN